VPKALGGFSYPSPPSAFNMVMATNPGPRILNQIFSDMGVDKGEAKNTAQQVNAQRQKQQPPQVSLNFFPANPSPGEEVTVTATPTYFLSDSKNLYFTWYIKHSNPSLPDRGNHDWNSDGKIDIEDYKIEAMRLIANGGFDWDPDGNGQPDGTVYDNHTDSDGYNAVFGGEDQRNKGTPHCYIHNWPSGDDYELASCEHLFADTNGRGDVGDNDFRMAEEQFWHTDPRNFDTRGASQKDEATVTGLGMFEFKFNYQDGDKVGVAIEGASYQPTQYRDSTYKTMWALVKNQCEWGSAIPRQNIPTGRTSNTASTSTTANAQVNSPAATCAYFDYTPFGICQPDNLQYRTVTAAGAATDPDSGSVIPDGCTGGTPYLTQGCAYGYGPDPDCVSFTYNTFGSCQPNSLQYTTVASTTPTDCSGGAVPVLSQSCTYTPPLPTSGVAINADTITADGINPVEWPDSGYLQIDSEIIHYNTITNFGSGAIFSNLQRGVSPTTAAFHADNAAIIGYTTTTDTQTIIDTSFNANQNNFTVLTTTNATTTVTDVRGTTIDGPTTVTDVTEATPNNEDTFSGTVSHINDCLEDNMLSPAEGNALEKLKINLFYTPTTPMFSTIEDNADFLILNAGLENASDQDYLIYNWQLYGPSFDPNPTGWTLLPKSSLPESTQNTGIGIKSFKFRMFFPDWGGSTVRYLKAKLTITERRTGQATETVMGNASVVIPIAPASDRLGIYSALPSSGSPTPQVSLGGIRCQNGVQGAVCPVVKDEIVGLSIDPNNTGSFTDVLWTVNGERVQYPECFFAGCNSEKHTGTMFIPILKDIGSQYTVTVTAIDNSPGSNGEKVTLTRTLMVVEPTMKIVSNDQGIGDSGARAVLLGTYVPLDPNSPPTGGINELQDFSDTDFQALPGAQASFSMEFNVPSLFRDDNKTSWFLDGQAVPAPGASGLTFPVNKLVGESYSVTANSIYRQDPLIQQMLNHYWGVRIDQIYEKQLNAKVDLSVVSVLNGIAAGSNTNTTFPKKFLAALSSGAPAYLIFLFRIALTAFLLLYFIRIILSLTPKNYETQ